VKILIFHPGQSGDALVSTAVLPGLRARHPDAELHYYGDAAHLWPLLHNPYVDRIEVLRDLESLRPHFDRVIVLQHADCWGKRMPNVHCDLAGVPFHPPQIFLSAAEEQWTERHGGFVAVWHRAAFADRCYDRMQAVIDAFPGERFVQMDKVEPKWRLRGAEYWGDLPLREAVVRMRGATLALGIDTVFMHAAAVWRVPMVLALGPTSHLTQYIPDASLLYGDARRFEARVGCNGTPADVNPRDLIDAVAERLGGALTGKNRRIVYTDDRGERVKSNSSRPLSRVRRYLRRSA